MTNDYKKIKKTKKIKRRIMRNLSGIWFWLINKKRYNKRYSFQYCLPNGTPESTVTSLLKKKNEESKQKTPTKTIRISLSPLLRNFFFICQQCSGTRIHVTKTRWRTGHDSFICYLRRRSVWSLFLRLGRWLRCGRLGLRLLLR